MRLLFALTLATSLAFWPAAAMAHGFGDSPTIAAAWAEGTAVMLGWPAVTACLIAGGLLAGLAYRSVRHLWLAFVIGQALALALTLTPQTWHFYAPFAAGMFAAAVALSGLYRTAALSRLAISLTGAGAQLAALDGHPLGDLPPMIYAGYIAVAALLVAGIAAALAALLRVLPMAKPQIIGQILASWCLAALVLMLAVVIRAAG